MKKIKINLPLNPCDQIHFADLDPPTREVGGVLLEDLLKTQTRYNLYDDFNRS